MRQKPMLLRVYRLTDRVGIVILKTSAAAIDWLIVGAHIIVSLIVSVFGFALALLLAAAGKVIGLFSNVAGKTSARASESVRAVVSETMARRAARDEIDVIMREDPLRVQNRRLSFLVLILGALAVAALLWATDGGTPVAVVNAPPANFNENAAAPAVTPQGTDVALVTGPATPIPTATAIPEALRARGAVVYTVRERGQTDLWALNVGSRNPIRLTNAAADERDPEWNSDGSRLAYASREGGNWDLYVYDVFADATSRVTVDLSFQANPSWSPDGVFLAYENYQGENLDIFALPIDGSSPPLPITNHPAPDFSPAWGPTARDIAFVSWRDGNQDIYVINLDDLSITNITNTPTINEDHPAWSPDGRTIAYSASENGSERVFVRSLDDPSTPRVIAFGRAPVFSPDGNSILFAVDALDSTRTDISAVTFGDGGVPIQVASVPFGSSALTWTTQPLPPQLVNAGGEPLGVTDSLYVEQTTTFDGSDFQLQSLGNVQVETPLLSDAVDNSFNALRQRTLEDAGVDFLGQLDDAFWPLERPAQPGEAARNWHRTGRAFSLTANSIRGFPPPIEVVREDVGIETYWRVYLRVDEEAQRGQLGEPLRRMPWDFLSTMQGDVEAFNQGGRLRREVPAGYYIDLTQLAADYGWARMAAGTDWRGNVAARNYWMFTRQDNLTWCSAMLQLYTEGELVNYECTE